MTLSYSSSNYSSAAVQCAIDQTLINITVKLMMLGQTIQSAASPVAGASGIIRHTFNRHYAIFSWDIARMWLFAETCYCYCYSTTECCCPVEFLLTCHYWLINEINCVRVYFTFWEVFHLKFKLFEWIRCTMGNRPTPIFIPPIAGQVYRVVTFYPFPKNLSQDNYHGKNIIDSNACMIIVTEFDDKMTKLWTTTRGFNCSLIHAVNVL